MSFVLKVIPEDQRATIIEEKRRHAETNPASEKYSSYDLFPGQKTDLTVIQVPIELPVYRLSNGRTQSRQLEWISINQVNLDYFERGQENLEAQKQQHEFLVELANKDTDGSLASIIEVLKDEKQTYPIRISPSGVVLDGNRRLAAMRSLYQRDPSAYSHFANVRVAVLPPLTESQELDYETRIQMKREVKLDYSWVDEAMVIERHKRMNKDNSTIARIMNETPANIENDLQALFEGRKYLAEWLNTPNAYAELTSQEQIFKDLPGKLKRQKSEFHRDAARKVQWVLINANRRDELGTRVYAVSDAVLRRIPDLVSKVVSGFPRLEPEPLTKDDFDFGESDEEMAMKHFSSMISNDDKDQIVRDFVTAASLEIYEEQRDQNRANTPLKNVIKAYTALSSVNIGEAAKESLDEIEGQLVAVEATARSLLQLILNRKQRDAT